MPIPQLQPTRRSYGNIPQKKLLDRIKIPKKAILKNVLILFLALTALGIIGGTIAVAWISKDLPDPNKLSERQIDQSTKIYDRTGEQLLYEVYQEQKRTLVELNQINHLAVKATIAVEDKFFYEHNGIRIKSILRAAFNNLLGRKTGGGGASTLTQQLIKNTVVGDERSYFRKIKEAILAVRLERKYDKDTIIKMYLNEIPYGSTNYGIESASQSYFQKSAKEISLSESAVLAGMIQAPSRYLNNLPSLKARRNYVLDLMFNQGQITEEEKNNAQNEELVLYNTSKIFDAPHFILYVKQILADQFGEKEVDTGGLTVITTLDYAKQKIAQDAVKELGDKFAEEYNANNSALVAMDPKTGQVLAMVGSRDFNNDEINGKFNVAILGRRQPGSSFKPFVYTAAFEKGYTPETVLYDVITDFERREGTDGYVPHNYTGKEYGLVTMRNALQWSLNIPAVKTLYLVGTDNMLKWAKRFGYSTFTGDPGLSLVLGGAEVTLLEHTNAYATLANQGTYHPPVHILKVTNAKGETLYEWKDDPGTEAVAPEISAITSNVLSDNEARSAIFGRNSTLTIPGRPVAAKTGTTNDYKDAWTMGYTPSLTVGVWVGNTQPSPMKGGGNTLAGAIWNRFMTESLKGTPAENFPEPPPKENTKPILTSGATGGIKLRLNKITGKIAASTTPDSFVIEKTFLPPHTILHYIDKNDPLGTTPTNPANDEQYSAWEDGLKDWVKRQTDAGIFVSLEEPPTEYDQPLSPELAPSITIISPISSSTIFSRQLNLEVTATAPRGVTEVVYTIDDQLVITVKEFPFSYNYYAKFLTKGIHTLRATAKDDIGNWNQAEIKFDLQAEMDPPDIDWVDSSITYLSEDIFPRVFYLNPWRWEDTKDIKIYLKSDTSNRLIYTFNHTEDQLQNRKLIFTWNNNPGIGSYVLQAVLTDKNGRTITKDLLVEVK